MPDLNKILEDSRPAIQAGLEQAERELAQLDARRQELTALIVRAKAVLGDAPPAMVAASPVERLTLHKAIERVLTEHPNQWMGAHAIADEINQRRLYEKRDRSDVDPSQIHARANKYPHMFEKDGPNIRLRAAESS